MRVGVLAIPESFAVACPFCGGRGIIASGVCSFCGDELRCSGFGDADMRTHHAMTCMEVACDLRYLPVEFAWTHVVSSYAARGEPLAGRERLRRSM